MLNDELEELLKNTAAVVNPFSIGATPGTFSSGVFNKKDVIEEIMDFLPKDFPQWHVLHSPDVEGESLGLCGLCRLGAQRSASTFRMTAGRSSGDLLQ